MVSESSPYPAKGSGGFPKFLIFLVLMLALVAVSFVAGNRLAISSQTNGSVTPTPTPTPIVNLIKDVNGDFTVQYPDNFFISTKAVNSLSVVDQKFQNQPGNWPEASVSAFINVIPETMSLKDWLIGVGDTQPVVGVGNTQPPAPKDCKPFIANIKKGFQGGDLFDSDQFKFGDCRYLGVKDVKDKTVGDLKGVEFTTQATSGGATHTILMKKYPLGGTELYDISYSGTGLSDASDKTVDAYTSFLTTFLPKGFLALFEEP